MTIGQWHGDLPQADVGTTEDMKLVAHVMDDLYPARRDCSEVEIFDQKRGKDLWAGQDWEVDPARTLAWLDRGRRKDLSFRYVVTPQLAREPLMNVIVPLFARYVQWRVLPTVPQRIFARDGLAFASVGPPGGRGEALVFQGAAAKSWVWCADHLWRKAAPWSPEQVAHDNARQAAVVELLLEGFGDDAIARRLDVSVRTVRRDVADLMVTHDARSRLQLGAALAAR